MKLLFISSLLVAATNAADVDRRRINGITFADQAVEALNLVHKGQAGSNSEQKLVVASKGDDKSSKDKDDKSSKDKSSNSSSSKSSSNSRDGRGVCGEKEGYCKDYDSSSFLNFKKEDGDNKSSKDSKSKSSSSKSKSSSSGSRDGSRRTDRCFRACDTDRCTSDDRRRLECPASTAASSDTVQKGQAGSNSNQKLVVASKGDDKSSKDKDDKSSKDKSSNSKSSSSKSSSNSRDGRGVCGEKEGYCKDYESSFLNFKKEGGDDKGGDSKSRDNKSSDKSSKSSRSSKSSTSSGSRDGSRRTDRCFRACDTDRCTSDDRRRLECPASTAASSDFVQKGQASPIQKLVWAGKKADEGEDSEGGDEPDSKKSSDENRNGNSKSSSSKSKSSSSTAGSGDNSRSWPGSGDDICTGAPKGWCAGSSADGDDACDDACDKDSDIRCTKDERKHLGCDKTSADGVAATKKLRRRRA